MSQRPADDVDHVRSIQDHLHLESMAGAVERLLQQCHDIGAPTLTDIRRTGDSVVFRQDGPLRIITTSRLFSALSVVLGGHQDNREDNYLPAMSALRQSQHAGVLAAITGDADGASLAFRIDPIADRWRLRDLIEAELGWRNDPSSWQVNITRRGDLLLAQVGPLYHSARLPKLRRIPASTTPLVAAVMVALLKPESGDLVYDPFCGAGTLLVEAAATVPGLRLLGSDISNQALIAATANQPHFANGQLLRANAQVLPVTGRSVHRIVANLPFGKRVGSHTNNVRMYPTFLAELTRVLVTNGRAVLLTEDKQLFRRSVQGTTGIHIIREVSLASGGLHPSAFVVTRTRAARRARPARGGTRPQHTERADRWPMAFRALNQHDNDQVW